MQRDARLSSRLHLDKKGHHRPREWHLLAQCRRHRWNNFPTNAETMEVNTKQTSYTQTTCMQHIRLTSFILEFEIDCFIFSLPRGMKRAICSDCLSTRMHLLVVVDKIFLYQCRGAFSYTVNYYRKKFLKKGRTFFPFYKRRVYTQQVGSIITKNMGALYHRQSYKTASEPTVHPIFQAEKLCEGSQ